MRMITNRIYMSAPKSSKLAETIKAASIQNEKLVKTASGTPETEVKVANIKNLGDYAHPKGEKQKKKQEGPVVEEEVKASKASTETEVKVAEGKDDKKGEKGVEKYDAGKLEATNFTNDEKKAPQDYEKPEKEAGKGATTTVKTPEGTFPSSGQTEWEGKPENNNKPEYPTDENTGYGNGVAGKKSRDSDEHETKEKKASADDLLKKVAERLGGQFIVVANMKPELKKDTKDYWRALFGEDYADAMVEDR